MATEKKIKDLESALKTLQEAIKEERKARQSIEISFWIMFVSWFFLALLILI